MRTLLLLLSAFLLPAGALAQPGATRIADDFSSYPEGSDAASAWDSGSVGWEVRRGRFENDGAGRSFAVPLKAPHARRMLLEATVTLRRATGSEWKVAGLALVRDDRNYWHLAVVETPDAQERRHFVELTEMRNGEWLANSQGDGKLTVTADRGGDFAWEYEHPYRFRLEVRADGIEGVISELDGAERARRAYAFDRPAVTAGQPALTTGSLAAAYDDVQITVEETAEPPAPPRYAPYRRLDPPGPMRGKATGYFHAERLGGRWWLVDPTGDTFYAVGTDHVNYNAHWCEKLGYAPYHRNVAAQHGTEEKWAASSTDRLKTWGFNTLGAGCGVSTRYRGLVHTEFLSLGRNFVDVSDIAPRTTWTGFPDVFHPRFAAWCERQARRLCAPLREDPWLLGYFLDNELEWYGKNGSETGLVDEAFKKPPGHPAKQALVAFLRARYPTVGALNRAWGTDVKSFEALAQSVEPLATRTDAGTNDRRAFVRLIAERYFAVTTAAIRKADPNHLILGCRFAGRAPGIWDIAGKHLDIVSVNYYGQVDMERGVTTDMPRAMAEYHAQSRRPLMITEWSFPALDAGLPSQHGAGQRVSTQKEKARCYAIYQQALFAMPYMVGSDYFMWVDEPALGISSTFPEDSNYGLVDVNDDAWPELTQTAARVNPLAYALHAGQTAELSGEIRAGGRPVLRVRNTGRAAARCTVRLWIRGAEQDVPVDLAPGARRDLPLRLSGPAFVSAAIDPDDAVLETNESDNSVEQAILAGMPAGPAVVVTNPSAERLENVPVSVALGRQGDRWRVSDAAGQLVISQVDRLPGGSELAFVAPELPGRSLVLFRLQAGEPALSKVDDGGDRAVALRGPLTLEHTVGSPDLFDRVALGDLPLGRFTVLVHQMVGQALWVRPDHVERIHLHAGPVRTVVVATVALRAPLESAATTAVGPEGAYAPQERRPAAYRATFRLTQRRGEAWFGARFLGLENTDARPWHCQAYYFYPLSAIAGRPEDDQPAGGGATPIWRDAAAGASYGAVVDPSKLRAHFWKDTPEGAGEHPDIWRELNLTLKPGQRVSATADDPEVLLFGSTSTAERPGGDTLERLRALARVGVRVAR